ncbi:MAG: glycosyltransferase family 4 protein [Candidatus Altiarchaeota archaeon]|nr:glycosyltransferase family 4 protein [Candidatus Altiarchaeota archaeon]
MKRFKVLFISSSSRYRIPEERSVYKKKFGALSKIADISWIAVSESGKKSIGECGGAKLFLAPRKGAKILDLMLFKEFALTEGLRVIKNRDIDIVYAQSPLMDGLMGAALKKLTGVKLIVGVHGDWEGEIRYSKPGIARFMPLINLWASFCLKNADLVRVISKATEERALEFVEKDKISSAKFPALFDVDFFLEGEPKASKEDSAVFVGSLIGRKGVDHLVKAVPKIRNEFPEFKLYVVGRGALEKELGSMAESLGVGENVVFAGHQPMERVREYIDKSQMLVLPSMSEGLGRIALEAMSRSRPVIGSAVEGIKETVKDGHNGILIRPGDSDAIANAVIKLLEDKKLAAEMGKNGRRFVQENYSVEKYVSHYERLFEEALGR